MKPLITMSLLLLLLTIKSFAQKPYTLADCYRLALSNNIAIQRAQNEINTSIIDRQTAQFNLLPSLSYGMEHYFSFGKNIDPVTNNYRNETFSGGSIGIDLKLKLFSGFSALNSIKQSKYLIDAAEYGKKKIELEVLKRITLTYAQLLFNKEQSVIERNNIKRTDKELEIVSEKIKIGKLSKYEYFILNARKNSEQANLITVQNDSLIALQELKEILNIPYNEKIDIAPIDTTVLAKIASTNISATNFIDMLLQKHPAIQQAKMDKQVALIDQKITKSSLLPSLYVAGNFGSNYNTSEQIGNSQKPTLQKQLTGNFGQNISVNLHVPIFSQMQVANRIKKQKINISNAQHAIREAENSVIRNSLQLVNDFSSAKQKYLATFVAWQQNNLSYSMYEEKYKLGVFSSIELITAKNILSSSDAKYLQAKFEVFFRYQLLEMLRAEF